MKKITQKALSLLLSVSLLLGMTQGAGLTAFAKAADATDSGVTAYYCDSGLYQDPNCTTPFDGDTKSITSIEVNDSTQAIGSSAFWRYESLTNITIPDSVETIGDAAFYDCEKLSSVTFGKNSSLKTIEEEAFRFCTSLTSVALPPSVESIGDDAFEDCSSLSSVTFDPDCRLQTIGDEAFEACALTSIKIPASVTSIGKDVFLECTALDEINVEEGNAAYSSKDGVLYNSDGKTLIICPEGKSGPFSVPEGVTDIAAYAFKQCCYLDRIRISDSVRSIGDWAFISCYKLSEIDVAESNTAYSSKDGVLYTNDKTTLVTCPEGKNGVLSLPDGVTAVADGAFEECFGLTGVVFPDSVTSIGAGAFVDCEKLSSVTFGADSRLETIGEDAFEYCSSLQSVELPPSVDSISEWAFEACINLKSVALTPSEKLTVADDSFFHCTNLRNLYLVGDSASDTLPSFSNTFLFAENGAGGYKLTKYTGTKAGILIPKTLYGKAVSPQIDPDSLEKTETVVYCDGKDLYQDKACTQVIDDSFRGLVTEVRFIDGVTSIFDNALRDCSSLTKVTIPASVTSDNSSVRSWTFDGCSQLTEIDVEEGNTAYSSKDGVLYNSDGKTLIVCPEGRSGTFSIPEGVTGIGEYAFRQCSYLDRIRISDSVRSIGSWAFMSCTKLSEINVNGGNATYSSKDGVLYNHDKTTLIFCPEGKSGTFSVPEGVEAIGEDAFEDCTGLTDVTISKSVRQIGEDAFFRCTALTRVVLKGSLDAIGEDAFREGPVTVTFIVPASLVACYQDKLNSSVMKETTAKIVGEKIVTAVAGLPAAQRVANGTAQADLKLPSSLTLTVDGKPETTAVTWTSTPTYDPSQAGTYTFSPVLPLEEGYVLDDGVSAEVAVTVQPLPGVSGVTVSPSTATIRRGNSLRFSAVVGGTNSPSQAVTWSVAGNQSPKTVMDQAGKLTVAADETASALTVKAVSASDPSKYGTAAVTVSGSDNGGGSGHHSSSSSSTVSTPSLPSAVTNSETGAAADLSGASFPSGVTGVSLSVTPETSAGVPEGALGGAADPQGAAAYRSAVSDAALNIIGAPHLYHLKLLDQNGNPVSFTGSVTVRIPVPAGIHGTPHVYRYEADGTLTDLGATVQDGYLVFTTTHFSYYIVAGTGDSITLDTRTYQMPVNGKYQIGVKLTGSKATSVKVTSTNDKTAAVTKLKNGNYEVTGNGLGTAYIMFDVYDSKNHLLAHASVRVDVKTGIRPRGDSTRQIGVF
ncbi:hypothetical protein A7X67_11830 [Clostridium sp. W14A]|nr:hypothetical protein A7X67_11830 [Clostridium sp. W14A]